jgi:hypothetical protein
MQASPVSRFFWRVFILLPVCFAIWYYYGNFLMLPASYAVSLIVPALFPDMVSSINPFGSNLNVVCAFAPPASQIPAAPEGKVAELFFELNVMKYAYCIPMYSALVLASPGEEKKKWAHWLMGLIILWITLAWGISFDVLKTILFGLGEEIGISQQARFSNWQVQAIALGYQFGYLILPAVTPLVLWIGFYREFLAELAFDKKPENEA